MSDKDYHNGVPTILKSETAALVKAEELFAKQKDGDKYHDEDFGPLNDDDLENSKSALYFSDPPPMGYVKPEDIIWLEAKEINGGERCKFVASDASANDVI